MRMDVHLGTQLCTGEAAAPTHIHLFWWFNYKNRSLLQGWKKGDSSKTPVHSRYSMQALISHVHFLYLLSTYCMAINYICKIRCRTLLSNPFLGYRMYRGWLSSTCCAGKLKFPWTWKINWYWFDSHAHFFGSSTC